MTPRPASPDGYSEPDAMLLDEYEPTPPPDVPDWLVLEQFERKYLVLLLAAQVAQNERGGTMVECIEHPEWGKMTHIEAARRAGFPSSRWAHRILDAVRTRGTARRLHWCKAGQRKRFRPKGQVHLAQPVRSLDTGHVYKSAKLAAAAVGCTASTVRESIRRFRNGLPSRLGSVRFRPVGQPVAVEQCEAAANNAGGEGIRRDDQPAPSVARLPVGGRLHQPHTTRARDGRDGSICAQLTASNGIARQKGAAA